MSTIEESVKKINDFYSFKPGADIYKKEFGYYAVDKWREQGYLKKEDEIDDYQSYFEELFHLDKNAVAGLGSLGWDVAEFYPKYDEEILEDRGECELVQDTSGRGVLYFKGRRQGYMPQYITHPVKDMKTWEENVKWRLNPNDPHRKILADKQAAEAAKGQAIGKIVRQWSIGGYMYLRSLMGPEDLLYKFYDEPELIHSCMESWLALADYITAYHQQSVSIDELFLGEDICYKTGSLIAPDMIREFLFPYYQQLIENMRRRNKKPLHLYIDTDGYCNCVIDLYKELGMTHISPLEVASGCDVVEIAKQYPDLLLEGGIDKRILADSKDAIAREVERIMSYMKPRGGYIPTCDHGVPEEVPFENYVYYRELMSHY